MPIAPSPPAPPSSNGCAKILEDARKQRPKYSSQATRDKIKTSLAERGVGFAPYDWQLDVAEALLLGLDCSVIAGTGAGKTLPFVLPLLAETGKMVLIISPLNALEEDQAARFNNMGLSAIAVNGETYSDDIHATVHPIVVYAGHITSLRAAHWRTTFGTPPSM